MDNMHIMIKNFIIIYENKTFYGYQTRLEIKFDELSIVTTDQSFQTTKFMHGSNTNYRLIDISKLSMNLKFLNNN